MKIWDQVQTSDPASIKEVSFGRKFNAINAQHQFKRATEVFGPFGEGWGIRDECYEMLIPGLLLYTAILWHGDKSDPNQFGISSSISTHSNSGKLDDEVAKKVSTDAITKGLSRLGFNADVFLGLWDDSRYVNTVKDEKAKVDTADAQDKMDAKRKELEAKAKLVRGEAELCADDGDPISIAKLWNDNKDLHSIRGFKTAIGKSGKKANEVKAEKENGDQGKAEG